MSKESGSHSPVAPRDAGTPIRQSRMANTNNNISNAAAPNAMQRRMTTNALDTPTLNASSKHPVQPDQTPQLGGGVMKQSSFGSVIYDSSRKEKNGVAFEDQRGVKQASSLSPTRMAHDISR